MLTPDQLRQYKALAETAGLIRLRDWTTLEITGEDRLSFLHNMCTNDIRSLRPGEGCEAFLTDVKGKIVGHVFVLAMVDSLYLLTAPQQSDRLASHLDRYIIREDVQLEESAGALAWTMLAGPQAAVVLNKAGQNDLPNAPLNHREGALGDIEVSLACWPLAWSGGYLLACATAQVDELTRLLEASGAALCDETGCYDRAGDDEVFNTLRVESAWPLYGVDFDETNLPQEVARNEQAIHFNKGCYLGQETIARIDALGHVNRELRTLKFSGDEAPAVGSDVLLGEKSVGRVTSSCFSPRQKAPLALAMLRREALSADEGLTCDGVTVALLQNEK